MRINNAKRWAVTSVVFIIIGIALIIAGIILNDFDHYWMIYVGIILTVTFIICLIMFLGMAKRLDSLFNNKQLLAHWIFESAEQVKKAEAEYKERKSLHKYLLIVVTFFFVVIGGLFLLFMFDDYDEAWVFAGIMLSILALIYIVALATPRIAYNRMKKSPAEVYVGFHGAWVMGAYTQWNAPMSKMTRVGLIRSEGSVFITVYFTIIQRFGPQMQVCRIPVPEGKEKEGEEIASRLASINGVEYKSYNE
ncbi:MAG: hypothetical protein PHX37_06005 [Eubacteriales bacterium]|nr:hypothetical protein [Eubacteriales bacterium]